MIPAPKIIPLEAITPLNVFLFECGLEQGVLNTSSPPSFPSTFFSPLSSHSSSFTHFLFLFPLIFLLVSIWFPFVLSLVQVFSLFFSCFLVADTRLYTLPCRSVGPSVRPSVCHIFEFPAFFALLLLPNRPRLDCRVSGLVFLISFSFLCILYS